VLAEGMPYIERAPWAVLIPILALALFLVLAVSLASLSPGLTGLHMRRNGKRGILAEDTFP
jgi:ABC-type dipeptide/oligopeptide/nickel transport system permease subunit